MTDKPIPLQVPPLRSGGVMLGYGCSLRCGHCNYRCGPDTGEWMDESRLAQAMDVLALEKKLVDVHLSGGEAMLRPDLTRTAVQMAVERNIRLSYMETNGFYATTVERAVDLLTPLREAGLRSILVSVSPYHLEHLPLERTMNCLEAGVAVFGHDSVFPWLAHFIPMMARLDASHPHPLEEFLHANGMEWGDPALLQLFPLSPGGRVPERLGDFFPKNPPEAYAGGNCLDILTDVSHFHIDPNGVLFTGHCPGIASGSLDDGFHTPKNVDEHPVFIALAMGGPYRLMQRAMDCGAFTPDEAGYTSPCDLCFQVRRSLVRQDAGAWPELAPVTYYD